MSCPTLIGLLPVPHRGRFSAYPVEGLALPLCTLLEKAMDEVENDRRTSPGGSHGFKALAVRLSMLPRASG